MRLQYFIEPTGNLSVGFAIFEYRDANRNCSSIDLSIVFDELNGLYFPDYASYLLEKKVSADRERRLNLLLYKRLYAVGSSRFATNFDLLKK